MISFYQSSVGKKIIMAVTGVILVGFLVSHVAANLLVFQGPGHLDAYARFLRGTGKVLWIARVVLLVALILHVDAAVKLTLRNRTSRPVGYHRRDPQASTLAARTMRVGGLLLLVFIVYHLLHFSFGPAHPTWPGFNHDTVYANVVAAFQTPWVVVFYELAMVAVGLHLVHGIDSMVVTLGLTNPRYRARWHVAATVLGWLVALGFASIPVAVWVGVVK